MKTSLPGVSFHLTVPSKPLRLTSLKKWPRPCQASFASRALSFAMISMATHAQMKRNTTILGCSSMQFKNEYQHRLEFGSLRRWPEWHNSSKLTQLIRTGATARRILAASGKEESPGLWDAGGSTQCPEQMHPGDNSVVDRIVWPQDSSAYTRPHQNKLSHI